MKAYLLIVVLLASALGCSTPKQSAASAMEGDAGAPVTDPVAARLDSLAAVSYGDYVHMEISPCFGRCEAHVSIYRGSPAEFHIYDAQAWIYNEFQRADVLYKLRRVVVSDKAENLIRRAGELGIMRLVNDSTHLMTDQSYIWVRARIGDRVVTVNHAYLGGERYAGDGAGKGLSDVYADLRRALLAPLVGKMEWPDDI